jgi:pantoate--beta-alanine ligase
MIIFKKADELSEYISRHKKQKIKTGFVPTMGALHNGHLSLLRMAKKENELCICSIFVNPTQFNNAEDFKHYPVTIEKDIELLVGHSCDILFLPAESEIYPHGYKPHHYDLGNLESILEGRYRPGHFQGVCQVVDRLLSIINPERLYMGQKDFQQCMVIKRLLHLLKLDNKIELKIVPTEREKDGLAMSSRNLRLDIQGRKMAPSIYAELHKIQNRIQLDPIDTLKRNATDSLERKGFKVDYVEIADVKDLMPASTNSSEKVALAAASLGPIRLIDNLLLNGS